MSFEIPKKDMAKVLDYERRKQLAIFRGQCFNNAFFMKGNLSIKEVYDLAQELYDEGIKRGWV